MLGLLLISLLAGCADYTLAGIEKRVPEVLVHPEHIDFGHLISGVESDSGFFSIINTGDDDLVVTSPVLISGNERFELSDEFPEQIIIPGGELLDVVVGYTPETFESNGGFIEFETSDEDEPLVKVTLEGYGDAPVMTVTPEEFDYGDISIGCDNEERVTITNEGNMPLTVNSVTQMVTQPADILMEFGSLPEPPWTIDPGLSLDFLVSYIPTDVGSDDSQITIEGNDPLTPLAEVLQHGDGDVEKWYNETHIQEEIPILDILWVVDDSGSMNRFQNNLSSNIGLFVNAFVATGADYRMAVVTTTDSQIGQIIDMNTPNPEVAIANEVLVGIGGSGMEYGIQKSVDALSSPNSAGPGGNFFRTDATLVVIYVSDEPDHGSPWSSYINFFDNIKPAGQFIPYAVIGDPPGGCTNHSGVGGAQYGRGYWNLVDHYNGDWYSICASDWGIQLQMMANSMAGRRSYELGEKDPIESTIEVSINGQVTTHWEYDSNENKIVFESGYVPDPGQTIDIEYAVWGCYE